jgi:hypothetical protein
MSRQDKPGLKGRGQDPDRDIVEFSGIEERRADLRRPTFKSGELLFNGGAIGCIVRNVSESGCLRKVENAALIPDIVDVRIDRDKPAQRAEIVWRSTTLAGAMFIRKPS